MIVYCAAMSLDGRISGPDHDLSFLQTLTAPNDYEDFYVGVDSLLTGARTQSRSSRSPATSPSWCG